MVKRSAPLRILAALAVFGLAAGGSAKAQEPITIGSFVATSGTGAPFGLDQLQAMQIAVKHINDKGGIGGRPLVLQHRDTAYDKTQAQSVMHGFVADKAIIGVVGPTSSAEAFAADPAAVAAKLPVLAPANGAAGVPQIGAYVHRIGVPEELLLPGAAQHAVKALGLKKVAILYAQDDPFATSGFKAFRDQLAADKVEVVETIGYDSAKTVDFTAQLQRAKSKNPDALFIAAKSSDASVLLRQARQNGMNMPVVGNLAFTSPALLAAAGDAVDGLIVAAVWDPSDPTELNQKFIADYKAAYNRDPTPLSAGAYNTIWIVKEALEKSKDISREGLQKGIQAMDGYQYLGVRIDFRPVGNGLRDAAVGTPVLFQYKGGKLNKLAS
jgi:branched-chain amino acid transport system substrate-binding protein